MSTTRVWLDVAVAIVVVVTMRVAFVVGPVRGRVPASVDRLGTFIAPAMAAALLVPFVTGPDGTGSAPDLVVCVLVAPVALRTRSVGWTLAVGMPVLWVARAVL